MKSRYLYLLFSLLLAQHLFAAQLPPGFAEEKIAEGLDPTAMTVAPDGRIFITEKNGRILIVENGVLLPDPFLQIEVDNYNERGLGGIVLDPGFEQNNFLYLFYTVAGGNHNRISRFTANGNYALPDSEVILFELQPLSGTIHNGGAMHFGPDGKLYIAVGDGANAANGQDLNTTLGKILRINTDGSIPEDNPFYNQLTGNNRAIWAYGFRNPFTTAMQPGTGRLFANDVGGGNFEEVNEILGGRNYGWPEVEGPLGNAPAPPSYKEPLFAYSHTIGCAVIGATFYNPQVQQFPPQYLGKYFFGDYCAGNLKVLDPDSGEIMETFATGIERPISLATAPDGSMYYLERRGLGGGSQIDNTSTSNGVLWRIFYTGSGAPFVSSHPSPVLVPAGEPATFEVSASGAPPLSYQWLRNDIDIPGENNSTLALTTSLTDDGSRFRCRVSNGIGEAISHEALLSVTANTRPDPVILAPSDNPTYRAGDTLFFSGMASDAEDGNLGAEQLIWRIDFHHDDHTHPAMAPVTGIENGFYLIPIVGETSDNVWYRVHLTAVDQEGLSRTVYKDILPEKNEITIHTEPPGLQLRVDGQTVTTPYTFTSVVGILRTIKAPATQLQGESIFTFSQWAGGSTQSTATFQAPDSLFSLTAYYEEALVGTGSGLTGAYYDEEEHNFEGTPAFWRIDTTVNFNWEGSSAAPALIGEDFYSIRWTGGIEPLFSEEHSFYLISDDGVRLWVNDELVIDQWVPQAPTETQGSIFLEKGRRYPIKLEYFEDGGGAVCQLFWSSSRLPREIIPKRQLYPDIPTIAGEEAESPQIRVFPQPAREEVSLLIDSGEGAALNARLLSMDGRLAWKGLLSHSAPRSLHRIDIRGLEPGLYVLNIVGGKWKWSGKVVVYR
ncbi:MAG: PQQ-dependent sugar dehydrogenase [Lewinellaceae bacterium]|nr:PQQ-dependent sugar dehydrogenase [Lewinellaceae bacterium]